MNSSISKKFYITTTLPYVNSDPHIGFAMEFIRADVIARYKRLLDYDVFFNTGTDEHGVKIFRKAEEQGIDVQKYVDNYADKFKNLVSILGISSDVVFTRTTDEHHIRSAQAFWSECKENGYIYKKNYTINYCVGCELEKTNSDLVDGKCPEHPNLAIEFIDEENYFFKFSDFQQKLLNLYEENPEFVIPSHRLNEIKSFVSRGLADFSISRLKTKMPWGIEVPDDKDHVMYVWFDALVNYISAIGWPDNIEKFNRWQVETGGMVQYCGKDNLRQQSAMWQAMLMAANLTPSKTIIIDGFITGAGGIKMSKSLGNTVEPSELVNQYGTDALRYYLLREVSPFEDSPFTKEMFKDAYNANLANGLGNLVSRVMKMAVSYNFDIKNNKEDDPKNTKVLIDKPINSFNIKKAMDDLWFFIESCDEYIQKEQPFKIIKTNPEKAKEIIIDLLLSLKSISYALKSIMPETSEKILELIKDNKVPEKPLFLRVE
jgi:methionyl-tRNA synthetase